MHHTEDHIHIPVSMSLPHFFMADPRVIRSVGGLNPNEEEHGTTVDVEPVSYYCCCDSESAKQSACRTFGVKNHTTAVAVS